MKFYSIKYLTVKGIEEVQGEEAKGLTSEGSGYFRFYVGFYNLLKIGRDCFKDRRDAVAAGCTKLERAILSHEKAIKRLRCQLAGLLDERG